MYNWFVKYNWFISFFALCKKKINRNHHCRRPAAKEMLSDVATNAKNIISADSACMKIVFPKETGF